MRLFDGLYTKGITQAEWELDTQSIRPFTGRIKNARDVQSAEELNGYECPFKTFTYNEPTTKLPVPILPQDGSAPPQVPDPQVPIFPGELQVTSVALDHPDFTTADIWLTYDGSYPGPANPAAFLSTDLPDDGQLPAALLPLPPQHLHLAALPRQPQLDPLQHVPERREVPADLLQDLKASDQLGEFTGGQWRR